MQDGVVNPVIECINFIRKDLCLIFFDTIEQKHAADENNGYDYPNNLRRDFYGNALAPIRLGKFEIRPTGMAHLNPSARKNAITGQNSTMPEINIPNAKNQLSIHSSFGATKNKMVNITAMNKRWARSASKAMR